MFYPSYILNFLFYTQSDRSHKLPIILDKFIILIYILLKIYHNLFSVLEFRLVICNNVPLKEIK